MFRVTGGTTSGGHDLTRRSFVEAGVLGVGGLSLAQMMSLRSDAAKLNSPNESASDTSVILIWMSGGPGHHETWDPKPDAVSQYRGPFGAISTNVGGIQFSEMLPEQAKIADRISFAQRSWQTLSLLVSDLALFVGKRIRMARASLANGGV